MKLHYITGCALLMMAYLAGEDRTVSSRELEQMICFPQQSIFSAGRKLKQSKLVNTISGPFGGYILAVSPENITIQDILLAFEDEFHISDEMLVKRSKKKTLHNFAKWLMNTEADMRQRMSMFTLADLLNDKD